jgi:hypothetical protein|tara:strand:- start:74 stop:406 length:333 start_codon:yes stop_codon:yes gene_type:complete
MKIEIDTKHDSAEEIKKVIKMLQHLVGHSAYTNSPNIFEDSTSFGTGSVSPETSPAPETSQGNAFVNMFGDTPTTSEAKEEPMDNSTEESQEATTEAAEEKEEVPEVIPY